MCVSIQSVHNFKTFQIKSVIKGTFIEWKGSESWNGRIVQELLKKKLIHFHNKAISANESVVKVVAKITKASDIKLSQ